MRSYRLDIWLEKNGAGQMMVNQKFCVCDEAEGDSILEDLQEQATAWYCDHHGFDSAKISSYQLM